ncbi:MAG TPA: acyltransferase family protein [Kineosporiaceae bacterium]|nr:acyltransferase family protein [Kineosporiaceae bacterium]
MTPVTGPGPGANGLGLDPGRASSLEPSQAFGLGPSQAFGLNPGQTPHPASATAAKIQPELRFTALDGLRGLVVPFVLIFALRADVARLHAPTAFQYLADGSYLLVDLLFVLAGFLLCRPLCAVLSGTSGSLFTDVARRIAPLHLLAWAITFGWVVTGAAPGTVWGWLSSALLLNGIVGPEQTGYPMSWSVSVALGGVLLLLTAALALSRAERRRRIPVISPGRLVTGIAVTTGLIGAALLLPIGLLGTEPAAGGTVGPAAIGQALLGLAVGLLSFRALEGGTGPLNPPRPGTAPAARPAPGLGSLLALAALVFCVYRSDLVHELDLLPIFPVAAGLVYFLAVPLASGPGPVNRLLDAAPLQWLGSRALALYLLHGPVQLTVERICEVRGFDRESTPVTYGVIAAVVLGSLVAADLAHRLLERAVSRPAPAPVAPVSVYRIPRSRPERISQIDPETIPQELRLLPLPRKAANGKGMPATTGQPVTAIPAGPAAPTSTTPSKPATAKPTAPTRITPSELATAKPTAPTGTTPSEPVTPRFGKPVGKPRSRPVSRPQASEVAPSKPAGKAPRPPASKATAKQIETPTAKSPITKPNETPTAKPAITKPNETPITKPNEAPTAKPAAKSIKLPADSPAELPTAQPTAKSTPKSIELPADQHIELPTAEPIELPIELPIKQPTGLPTEQATAKPARKPAPRKRAAKPTDT